MLAAATTLAACAGPTEPVFNVGDNGSEASAPPATPSVADLSGGWEGEIEGHGIVLALEIMQTGDRVSGLAELDGVPLTVSGTVFRPTSIDPPATQLVIVTPTADEITFEGSLIGGQLFAQLNGAIFKASDVVLSRTD
jgi:hypothetical protein